LKVESMGGMDGFRRGREKRRAGGKSSALPPPAWTSAKVRDGVGHALACGRERIADGEDDAKHDGLLGSVKADR
jgi:hypothetical protein